MKSRSSTGHPPGLPADSLLAAASALLLAAVAVAHPPGDPRPLPAGAVAAGASVTREAGIEFVTIPLAGRQPGQANPGWAGNGTPGDVNVGRGSVGYEYRIGRYEVTAGQWSEFFDAVSRVPGGVPFVGTGQRGVNTSLLPRGNISWRTAAIYCNWLHNNKGTTLDAFTSGAYSVSTFGFYPGTSGAFSDQLTRSPGARFFIPSLDEWIKAAHYDPSRLETPITTNTQGGAGYWLYPITSDTIPVSGPAGQLMVPRPGSAYTMISPNGVPAQSNSGWSAESIPGFSPFNIPLGAYTAVMSPWGLFDASGGTSEWVEDAEDAFPPSVRYMRGSAWNTAPGTARAADRLSVNGNGGDWPGFNFFDYGFRVAALIPAPSTAAVLGVLGFWGIQRRRHA